MRRTVNARALLALLLLTLVLGVALFFLHRHQLDRQVDFYLQQADQAQAQRDYTHALTHLQRYVLLRPGDAQAQYRYVALVCDAARTQEEKVRAYLALEKALRTTPSTDDSAGPGVSRRDLIKRAANLANELKRYRDALIHLEGLLAATPDDLELKEWQGAALEGQNKFPQAETVYREIIRKAPDRVSAYESLARVQGQGRNEAGVEQTLAQLVEANPKSAKARLVRAEFFQRRGKLPQAKEELGFARTLTADELTRAQVLLDSAEVASAEAAATEAEKYYAQGAAQFPRDARFLLGLAQMNLSRGPAGRPEALRLLKQALPLVLPGSNEQWLAAKLFLDAGDRQQAVALSAALRKKSGVVTLPLLDYINARLLFDEGKFGEGAAVLERIAESLARMPAVALDADLRLAAAYDALKNPDARLAVLERIAKNDSSRTVPGAAPQGLSTDLQLARADVLVSINRLNEAVELYKSALSGAPKTMQSSARHRLIRALIKRELARPEGQRDWAEVDKGMNELPPGDQKSLQHRLLAFEVAWAQKRTDALEKAVNDACREDPKEPAYWAAKIALVEWRYARDPAGLARQVEQCVQDAERAAGDRVAFRLARARLAAAGPRDQAAGRLLALNQGTDKFSPGERVALSTGLADLCTRLGLSREAKSLLTGALDLLPLNFPVIVRLADFAVAENDEAQLQHLVKLLRDKEGEAGVVWRLCRLNQLLAKLPKDDSVLTEARTLADELSKGSPNSARAVTTQGRLYLLEARRQARLAAEAQGPPQERDLTRKSALEQQRAFEQLALEKFQRAIELGERHGEVIIKTVQMLVEKNRSADARQLVSTYLNDLEGTPFLANLAVKVSLAEGARAERPEQTLALVKGAVRPDSTDYQEFLWQGTLLWALKDQPAAEAALRRATELGPHEPRTWAEWVVFLVKTNRKDEAAREIARADGLVKERMPQVLAPYYEALNEPAKVEEQLRKIQAARPDDPGVRAQLAVYYLQRGELDKAEPQLKFLSQAAGLETQLTKWAQRSYALALAAKGDYPSFLQAKTLVDQNLRNNPSSPEDLRTRALVLSTRSTSHKDDIIRDLEESRSVPLRPNEALVLAQFYEENGDRPKALEVLAELVATEAGAKPYYLAYYVRALVRQALALAQSGKDAKDLLDRAEPWLKKLQEMDPKSLLTMEAKARLLLARSRKREALALVEEQTSAWFAERKDPEVFRQMSEFLEEVKETAAAQAAVERYVREASAKQPAAVLAQVSFLARTGRPAEAITLCERSWDKLPPGDVAAAAVAAFLMDPTNATDFARLETRLSETAQRVPADVRVRLALAGLYGAGGRGADAEAIYRSLLSRDAGTVLVLNNLAWLLSERGDAGGEALALINRAIERAGPAAPLLDTRALIQLRGNNYPAALADMNEALTQSPKATYHMHLALVHHRANAPAEAERSWKAALAKGLEPGRLPASERAIYSELATRYKR